MDKTWGTPGAVDDEAQNLLNNLREKDLPKVMTNKNVIQYNVKWSKNGIDPEVSSEHAQYIKKLTKDFYEKLTEMISDGITENETADTREPLAEEIFQHLSFCQKKCKAFFGRKEFLGSIKNGLTNNDKRSIVLFGESGCGKTSLMAKVATDVKSWFENESVIVVCRFIGTSPESSSIRPLLRSVCQQLCKISGEAANIPEVYHTVILFYYC
jgi:flagellar biosynthesis GTPase FlhF